MIGQKTACDKLVKKWKIAKSCTKKREWLDQFLDNSFKNWIDSLIWLNANVGFMSVLNNLNLGVDIMCMWPVTALGIIKFHYRLQNRITIYVITKN